MTSDPSDAELDMKGLDQRPPEEALQILRRHILERLEWLAVHLSTGNRGESALDRLVLSNALERATVESIREVLATAERASDGELKPADAAVVVTSAALVATSLDRLVKSVEVKLQSQPPLRRLGYAFIALPEPTRWNIASELGLADLADRWLPRAEFMKVAFARARNDGKLAELWRRVAQASTDLPEAPPPGFR